MRATFANSLSLGDCPKVKVVLFASVVLEVNVIFGAIVGTSLWRCHFPPLLGVPPRGVLGAVNNGLFCVEGINLGSE